MATKKAAMKKDAPTKSAAKKTAPEALDMPDLPDKPEIAEAPKAKSEPVALLHLWQAQALPAAPPGALIEPATIAAGLIEQFADADGSTQVIVLVDGVPHKTPADIKGS